MERQDQQEIMTTAEVADMLQVSVSTLKYWLYCDKAPASIKIGKHRRFRRSDVQRWIDEHTAEHYVAAR
jgi:excisionase family DNA binding protein